MAIFVLLVPLAISFLGWNAARQHAQERAEENFDYLVHEDDTALLGRLQSYSGTLRAAVGLFHGSISVSGAEWRAFVAALDPKTALPGMVGMGLFEPVAPERLASWLAERRRMDPAFGVQAGVSSEDLMLVRYAEPAEASHLLGLNIAMHAGWRAAAARARDTGEPALGGGEAGGEFLLAQPLYDAHMPTDTVELRRRALTGWLFATFAAGEFFSGLTAGQGSMFHLQVFSGNAADPATLVYSSAESMTAHAAPQVTRTRQYTLMAEPFTLVWSSTPRFEASVASNEPMLLLVGGYLFTALFGALLMTFARQTDMVLVKVREKTHQIIAGERRMGQIVANMMDGMVTINDTGLIESFNPAAERIFGYRASEVAGKNVSMLMAAPERDKHDGYIRDYLERGTGQIIGVRREREGVRKDGTVFPLELAVSEIQQGDGSLFCGFVRDLTELKEMERLKSDFVSMVSHELRTPLTSIRGSLGLIAGTQQEGLPRKVSELIEIALSNSERLILLINDILDLDKVASGRMEFTFSVANLAQQCQQAIIANRAYADRYRVELVPLEMYPAAVRIDPARLMQVLSNLISNAVKHSPEGARIEISVRLRNGMARVSVRDFGEGIPEAFRHRVFSRFAQANSSSTRDRGGTGLGLSISRQIVQQLGGTIEFESEIGKGTVFHLDLPIVAEATDPHPDRRSQREADAPPQVLYVADDGDFSRFLSVALGDQARLVTSTSVRDAEWLLEREDFALVVADLTKPGGAGERLVNSPLSLVDANEIPVLVLVAANGVGVLNQDVAAVLVRSDVSVTDIADAVARLLRPDDAAPLEETEEGSQWAS